MALSYNTIFGKALHFPGAISAPEDLIAAAETYEWSAAEGELKIQRSAFHTEDATFIGEIAAVMKAYAEAVGAPDPISDEDLANLSSIDIEVSKFPVNSEFGNHKDSDTSEEETPGVVSLVLILNDNHGGGEFGFVDVDGEVSVSAGDVLAFPSYLERYTTAVEDSVKYYATINLTLDV